MCFAFLRRSLPCKAMSMLGECELTPDDPPWGPQHWTPLHHNEHGTDEQLNQDVSVFTNSAGTEQIVSFRGHYSICQYVPGHQHWRYLPSKHQLALCLEGKSSTMKCQRTAIFRSDRHLTWVKRCTSEWSIASSYCTSISNLKARDSCWLSVCDRKRLTVPSNFTVHQGCYSILLTCHGQSARCSVVSHTL